MDALNIEATEQLRRKVLIGMCLNLGGAALFLGVANIFIFEHKAMALGVMEIFYFFISAFMLFYIRNRSHPKWFLAFHSFVLAFLIIFGTHSKLIEEALFVWAIVLPTVFYLAMGKQVGFYWSLVCLILEVYVIYLGASATEWIPATLLANFILAYLCIWVVSHAYETSRVRAVTDLKALALHDALTGARNRLALYSTVDGQKGIDELQYALVLDIDDFKQFNDLYGHDAGDAVLVECVKRIQNIAGESNTFRVGGEELVVLVRHGEFDIQDVVTQLHRAVSRQVLMFGDVKLSISFSAGLEKYRTTENFDTVLARADADLYQAKQAGKSCTFYQGAKFAEA